MEWHDTSIIALKDNTATFAAITGFTAINQDRDVTTGKDL